MRRNLIALDLQVGVVAEGDGDRLFQADRSDLSGGYLLRSRQLQGGIREALVVAQRSTGRFIGAKQTARKLWTAQIIGGIKRRSRTQQRVQTVELLVQLIPAALQLAGAAAFVQAWSRINLGLCLGHALAQHAHHRNHEGTLDE